MIVLRVLPSLPLQGRLGTRQALGEEAGLASPLLHGSGLPLFLPCPVSLMVSFSPQAGRRGLTLPQAWEGRPSPWRVEAFPENWCPWPRGTEDGRTELRESRARRERREGWAQAGF